MNPGRFLVYSMSLLLAPLSVTDFPVIDAVTLPHAGGGELTLVAGFGVEESRSLAGYEGVNLVRPYTLGRWAFAAMGDTSQDSMQKLWAFYLARREAYGFELKDNIDNTDFAMAGVGVILMLAGAYRLCKRYADPIRPYVRVITHPVAETLSLNCPGTNLTVERGSGIVRGASGPGSWTGSFRVPVRFERGATSLSAKPADDNERHLLEFRSAFSEVFMPWQGVT